MTGISGETVITIGGLLAIGQLVQIYLAIRKASRDEAPKPPNQDLDKHLTRINSEVTEHGRRITAIETARAACQAHHMEEIGNLYKRINGTAERLAEIAGTLEMLVNGYRKGDRK